MIYLDSAATSLTPQVVIDAMDEYYQHYNANVHRGIHTVSELATQKYEESRNKIAEFLNADPKEVIFTRGTTAGLNMLANAYEDQVSEHDEIIITQMEHHSNIVPWQQLAKRKKAILRYVKLSDDCSLDMEHLKSFINENTKIIALTHMSNVLGTINDVKKVARLAHDAGAVCIVDGAQAVSHLKIDVKDLDVDYYVFSGHKMFGPSGIGVVYGKKSLLNDLSPVEFGGDMILEVSFEGSSWNELPYKFEAGTPPIAEVIGLGAAVEFMNTLDLSKEKEIIEYATQKLSSIEGLTLFGPKNRGPVFSFALEGIHPHDVAEVLDREGIAVRAGHLCAMPLVREVLKVPAVTRASFSVCSPKSDVDAVVKGIKKVFEVFK